MKMKTFCASDDAQTTRWVSNSATERAEAEVGAVEVGAEVGAEIDVGAEVATGAAVAVETVPMSAVLGSVDKVAMAPPAVKSTRACQAWVN